MIRIHIRRNSRISQALSLAIRSLCLTLIASILVTTGSLLWLRVHGEQLLSVQTASMVPTFRPGDAVIVQRVRPLNLRVGDIISYQSLRDSSLIISHRLIRIDQRTGWLTTEGDALHSPDPTIPPRLVVGQVTAIAPRFGTVLDALRRPLGLALLIYLPAIVIIVGEVRRLIDHYSRRRYYRELGHRYIASRRTG